MTPTYRSKPHNVLACQITHEFATDKSQWPAWVRDCKPQVALANKIAPVSAVVQVCVRPAGMQATYLVSYGMWLVIEDAREAVRILTNETFHQRYELLPDHATPWMQPAPDKTAPTYATETA